MTRRLCSLLTVLLCACSDPGSQSSPDKLACPIFPIVTHGCGQRLTGSGTSLEVVKALTCPECTVENPELALDDDPATYATVTVPIEVDRPIGDGGGITLIAHAPAGIVYSGHPGIDFSFASTSVGGWIFVHTSLGGQPYPA